MKSYNDLKTWCKDHKKELLVCLGFALMLVVGYGIGIYEKPLRRQNVQSNYTTATAKKPVTAEAGAPAANVPAMGNVAGAATTTGDSGDCIIKGNISATSKIYHVKGGAFYERTKAEQCFNTEAEAVAAGFRKSSR